LHLQVFAQLLNLFNIELIKVYVVKSVHHDEADFVVADLEALEELFFAVFEVEFFANLLECL